MEGTIQRLHTTSPEIIEGETTTPEETASTSVTGKTMTEFPLTIKHYYNRRSFVIDCHSRSSYIFNQQKEKKYNGYNEEFAATDEETQEEATAELEEVSKETEENKKVLNLNAAGQNYCFCCVYLL